MPLRGVGTYLSQSVLLGAPFNYQDRCDSRTVVDSPFLDISGGSKNGGQVSANAPLHVLYGR